jgi:hypothetical protein
MKVHHKRLNQSLEKLRVVPQLLPRVSMTPPVILIKAIHHKKVKYRRVHHDLHELPLKSKIYKKKLRFIHNNKSFFSSLEALKKFLKLRHIL